MTAILNRPGGPKLLPARHSRLTWRDLFVAAARNADRPWSIAVDALVLAGFVGILLWEGGEFAVTGVWEHLAAAVVVVVAGMFYAVRVVTGPTRSETNR